MRKIIISADEITATAVLKENPTADAVWKALPMKARANTWGDEIYFNIPVEIKESDDAIEVVNKGDIAFWPPGKAFCIFFRSNPGQPQQ